MTTRVANAWGKTRPLDNPYAVFTAPNGWEWRVLKAYQTPEKEKENWRWARWLCAVKSPFTYGSWEYGDTYITDIPGAYAGYRGEE